MAATERHRIFPEPARDRLANYFARWSTPRPLAYRSRAAWIARRAEVRRLARVALGIDPIPERLPLDVRWGGTLARPGYEVCRLYWQTWPGVYASGWLYRPAELAAPAPAILYPHGHREGGALPPTGQACLIALAKLGYVALAVDAVHLYDHAVGVNPAGVMTWNHLRALDLLTSMPEVDAERLGVIGAGDGAPPLACLLALDERPRAAVLIADFRPALFPDNLHGPGDAGPGPGCALDQLELIAVFAPRPLLFLTPEGNETRPFPEHELLEFRSLYRLYSQPDRLGHAQFPGPPDDHRPMRERIYAWFERWLRGRPDARPTEPDHEPEDPAALLALDRPPAEHHGWEAVGHYYRERAALQPPRLESRDTRKRWQERLREELRELVGETAPSVALDLQRHERRERRGYRLEKISFATEPEVRVPALLLVPEGAARAPAAVLLHPEGKAGWFRGSQPAPLPRALLDAGWILLLPDPRLRGELQIDGKYHPLLWGRPEAGMAARDALASLDLLYRLAEVDWRRLLLLGLGDMGVPALLAGGWDERVAAVVADCACTTYRDGGVGLPLIPNVLRVADLPQMAALTAPRPLWLFQVPPERVGFASLRYYDFTRRMYQGLGALEALRMEAGPPAGPLLLDWLARQWRRLPKG